jgi:hypothetical protein
MLLSRSRGTMALGDSIIFPRLTYPDYSRECQRIQVTVLKFRIVAKKSEVGYNGARLDVAFVELVGDVRLIFYSEEVMPNG